MIDKKMNRFDSNGAWLSYWEKTGWNYINGGWYYILGPEGKVQTGWDVIGGETYYFALYDGRMYYGGVHIIDNVPYFLNDDGQLQTGWIYTDWGYIFYADGSGVLQTGWQTINSKKYYFDKSNYNMYRGGTFKIDNVEYYFNEDGVCAAG